MSQPSTATKAPWLYVDGPGAKAAPIRSGKWMLYVPPDAVDEVWAKVTAAVIEGRLGPSAKVATAAGTPRRRVICVYTRDWNHREDATRVLGELRQIGFAQQRLTYKGDATTRAGVYGDGAALFVSQPGSLGFEVREPPAFDESARPVVRRRVASGGRSDPGNLGRPPGSAETNSGRPRPPISPPPTKVRDQPLAVAGEVVVEGFPLPQLTRRD